MDFSDQEFHIGMDIQEALVYRNPHHDMELRRFSMNPLPLELARICEDITLAVVITAFTKLVFVVFGFTTN